MSTDAKPALGFSRQAGSLHPRATFVAARLVLLLVSMAVLPSARAAHLTIDDSVESQIEVRNDANWELGTVSNGTPFPGSTPGSTIAVGESATFSGGWRARDLGSPDPGDGVLYLVDPAQPGTVRVMIMASWDTNDMGGSSNDTMIWLDVLSSPSCSDLGPLLAAFAGLGVPISTGSMGIARAFRDPLTAVSQSIPSNLGMTFVPPLSATAVPGLTATDVPSMGCNPGGTLLEVVPLAGSVCGSPTYQWFMDGAALPGETGPSLLATVIRYSAGDRVFHYEVTCTPASTCVSPSETETVTLSLDPSLVPLPVGRWLFATGHADPRAVDITTDLDWSGDPWSPRAAEHYHVHRGTDPRNLALVSAIEPHLSTTWTDSTPASVQRPSCHYYRVFAANDCEIVSPD